MRVYNPNSSRSGLLLSLLAIQQGGQTLFVARKPRRVDVLRSRLVEAKAELKAAYEAYKAIDPREYDPFGVDIEGPELDRMNSALTAKHKIEQELREEEARCRCEDDRRNEEYR